MRGRQADRERDRGERERGPRKRREAGEGLKGPQASSNLWHGKQEELAPSASVCAYTPRRKARGHSASLFFSHTVYQDSVTLLPSPLSDITL